MKRKFKLLRSNSKAPFKSHKTDIGHDLTASTVEYKLTANLEPYIKIGLGISIDYVHGESVKIYPRSSIYKKSLQLCNSVGVIDDYTGELFAIFKSTNLGISDENHYKVGDVCCQMVIELVSMADWVESDIDRYSERGDGGFGSTD
jgi:deoxyuridine 5'-triphosphate nucleotidohydrolase